MSEPRNPPYRIETPRLMLRCWRPSDAVAMRASLDASHDHLRPFIPFMRHEPRSLSDTAHWLREIRATFDRDEHYRYAVFDATETDLIGEVMLLDRNGDGEWEIGYWQDVSRGGQGFASEAAKVMLRIAFDFLKVERLALDCSPANERSIALAERLGFHHEATLRQRYEDCDGNVQDTMVWSMFAQDYADGDAKALQLRALDCLGGELDL